MNEYKIGQGSHGMSASLILGGECDISENSVSYWCSGIFNSDLVIMKDTDEGAKLNSMILDVSKHYLINSYIDSLIIKLIPIETVYYHLKQVKAESIELGKTELRSDLRDLLKF